MTTTHAWGVNREEYGTSFVHPLNDVIEHDIYSQDCICGPTVEPVKADDGFVGWTIVHHSLDGRENDE